jgi:Flp pilus assembly protein TadD
LEDALPHFRQAVRLNPGNETARRHLATALTQLGVTNHAISSSGAKLPAD